MAEKPEAQKDSFGLSMAILAVGVAIGMAIWLLRRIM